MIRKQVYLYPRQERALRRMARESGKTESTIIAGALDRLILETRRRKVLGEGWDAERAFIEQ